MKLQKSNDVQEKTVCKDEFDEYLRQQCLRTTFEGIEIDSFSLYRKMLGIY